MKYLQGKVGIIVKGLPVQTQTATPSVTATTSWVVLFFMTLKYRPVEEQTISAAFCSECEVQGHTVSVKHKLQRMSVICQIQNQLFD